MPQYKSQLVRFAGNPLFRPEEFPYGIADQVFNPGQVMTPDGRTILLLSVLPRGERLARCHVAESSDGMVTLYTNSGTPLPVIECEEDEMCGAAHKFHFCPNKKRERKTK